jgi:16S rRNA (uracil1498-N3)-methyltransferase
MSSRRFMIDSRIIRQGCATCEGDLFNHIVRVLRMGSNDSLILVDETGCEHRGSIERVERDRALVRIVSSHQTLESAGGAPRLTICQALPKGEKTELILQKGTELGAHDFWLFAGMRSVARVRQDQLAGKLERWNRITAEAARQCGRRDIPRVTWFSGVEEAAGNSRHELRLLLWEGEAKRCLKETVAGQSRPVSAIVAIGPEGGFDSGEVDRFTRLGFLPVSLGVRILRTETAALAITAILQYIWDDI